MQFSILAVESGEPDGHQIPIQSVLCAGALPSRINIFLHLFPFPSPTLRCSWLRGVSPFSTVYQLARFHDRQAKAPLGASIEGRFAVLKE